MGADSAATIAAAAARRGVAAAARDREHAAGGGLVAALTAAVTAWTAHLAAHPDDLAAVRGTLFEPDDPARLAAAEAMAVEHRKILEPLVQQARAAGELADDIDDDDLAELLATVLPQLAIAPLVSPPEPGVPDAAATAAVRELLAHLDTAFAPS